MTSLIAFVLAQVPSMARAAEVRVVQMNVFDKRNNGSIDLDIFTGSNVAMMGRSLAMSVLRARSSLATLTG